MTLSFAKVPPSQTVCLAEKSTMNVGGTTNNFYEIIGSDQIPTTVEHLELSKQKFLLLGGGSNVVIAESLGDLAVLQLKMNDILVAAAQDGSYHLSAAAGTEWDALVAFACNEGLSGIECLSGIPGHVGAAPVQNIGAYGQELADHFISLEAYDLVTKAFVTLSHKECNFSYRESIFKSTAAGRYIITKITLKLSKSSPADPNYKDLATSLQNTENPKDSIPDQLNLIRRHVLAIRGQKGMLISAEPPISRSCGSFFTNPVLSLDELAAFKTNLKSTRPELEVNCPIFQSSDHLFKLSAGWLIEKAGFAKGHRDGATGLSPLHTLAIINYDNATSEDIYRLAQKIILTVLEKFGIALAIEPTFVP